MLERFLSFARPLSGDRAPVELDEIITEAIETTAALARESGIRITLHSGTPGSPDYEVIGDRVLLKQVFINLIQNGIEAMTGGGTIAITVRSSAVPVDGSSRVALAEQLPGPDRGTSPPNHREGVFRIEIADQGSGIPETDRGHIFRPFFTSKETGTGLGLPLAKKIAVFHGGNLTLERSGPEGSVFVVTLPAQRTSGRPSEEPGRPESVCAVSQPVAASSH
jgi:two-component system sensor histidine kinase HydH